MSAIDNAVSNLAEDGIMGVADFFTSAKYDLPNRQHRYIQLWFWRSVFDVDGIGKALSLSLSLSLLAWFPLLMWLRASAHYGIIVVLPWNYCCGDFALIS